MSDDDQRRRGRASLHLNGGSRLSRAPCEPEDGIGPYTREQLIRMDSDFVAAMERAIACGLERRPERRITCTFRGCSAAEAQPNAGRACHATMHSRSR